MPSSLAKIVIAVGFLAAVGVQVVAPRVRVAPPPSPTGAGPRLVPPPTNGAR